MILENLICLTVRVVNQEVNIDGNTALERNT